MHPPTSPRVLLLNPQTPYYEMRYMKRPSRIWQPISLGHIAAMLEQARAGDDLALLDANALAMPPAQVAERAGELAPGIVVLNSAQHDRWQNPIPTIDHVRELMDALNGSAPDAIYVVLGPHGTEFPAHTFDEIPELDFIVRGEPEKTTVELIRRLCGGESCDDLQGISFVRDGTCVDNPDLPFVDDLDSLPMPAYHRMPMDRYRYRGEADEPGNEDERFAFLITSRGCPYQCSYCSLTMLGHRYRVRSIEKVLEEIDLLVREYGVQKIIFHDQILTLKKPRVKELCEGMVALGHDLEWYCQGVVNKFPTDLLGLMKQAGCKQINFGLESGVEEVSGRMRKNSVADFVKLYEEGQQVGVDIIPNHMVGLPGETPELARQSNEFYKKFGFKYYFASPTIPYPGTELYEIGRKNGTIKGETWQDVLDATGLVDNSFDKESMAELVDELFDEERRQEEAAAASEGTVGRRRLAFDRKRPMKLGIIGAGSMARRHLAACLALEGVEVVAAAGASERNRDAFVGLARAQGRALDAFYSDHRDLLARGDVEAVSVVTPTHTHAEIVQDCFEAGCHVLCEKPISRTLPEARAMLQAAERADRILMLGFTMRFFPEFRRVKQLIQAGEVGAVKTLWLRRSRRLPEQAWYADPDKSGGVLLELGIHLIDLARWLVASPIRSVAAATQGEVHGLGKEDAAWLLLEFANGAIGSIGASYGFSLVPNDFGLIGTAKSLAVDGERVVVEDPRAGHSAVCEPDATAGDPLGAELAHFIDCIREGSEPLATGEDGVASLAVALAALEAAKSGERVRCPGERRTDVKALVTGIAGFTGFHLADFLLGRDVELVGTVHRSAGTPAAKSLASRASLVECDVCDFERTRAVVRDIRPDLVFHLAGRTTSRMGTDDLRSTFDANIFGTLSVLEAVRHEASGAVVVVPGSSAEYGLLLPGGAAVRESDPLRPVNPYAVSKIAQGMVALQAHLAHGQNIVRTRTFNCIGPGQSSAFVCSAFARQIAEIERGDRAAVIEVGNLDASRDFVDARDVAEAYWLAATRGQAGEVYNVSSGRAHVIHDALKTLLGMSEVPIEVRQDPTRMQPSDVPVQVGDFGKLRAQTGWEPRISIETSLADTLACWRNTLSS